MYQAVHEPTGRLVALKRILPDSVMDERANRLFHREIGVMAKMSHPNLIRFYDQGEADGQYYFVTEYLAGGDLDNVVISQYEGPADVGVACRLVCQVLELSHVERVVSFRKSQRPLDRVLQLPHVAVPRVLKEQLLGPSCQHNPRLAHIFREPVEEVLRQREDILLTFP